MKHLGYWGGRSGINEINIVSPNTGTNPCASRTCRGYESCVINKFGIAGCACAMKCDPVVSPVCGSDGRTYDSHCDLTHSACRDGRTLAVAYKGTCGKWS